MNSRKPQKINSKLEKIEKEAMRSFCRSPELRIVASSCKETNLMETGDGSKVFREINNNKHLLRTLFLLKLTFQSEEEMRIFFI